MVTLSNDIQAPCNRINTPGPNFGQPKPLAQQGSINFGVVYGRPEFVQAQLEEKLEDTTRVINPNDPLSRFLLRSLVDDTNLRRQDVFAMISYCINARPMYSARNVPPERIMPMLVEFDRRVGEALAKLIELEDEQAKAELERIRVLPRSRRGLGVSAYSAHYGLIAQQAFADCTRQLRAFFSSEMGERLAGGSRDAGSQSRQLLDRLRNCRQLPEMVAADMPAAMRQLCVNDGGVLKQHLVYKYEVRRIHEELIAQNRRQAAALWVSGQHPQALAFLDYHGSTDPRLRIEDEAWKQYTRLIANQPPFVPIAAAPGAIGHFCNCQAEVPLGELPWHGLMCRKNAGIITHRHNSIVLALYQHILRNAGPMGIDDYLVADMKSPGEDDDDEQRLDPDGRCRIINMEGNRAPQGSRTRVDLVLHMGELTVAMDVAVVNPTANCWIEQQADRNPEVAIEGYYKRKREKHVPNLPPESDTFQFYPIVIDVMGRMHKESEDFLRQFTVNDPPKWRSLKRLMSSRIADLTAQNVINVNGLAEAAAMEAEAAVNEFGDQEEGAEGVEQPAPA